MKALNDVADALRRVAGISAGSPSAAFHRVPGMGAAVANVETALGAAGMRGSEAGADGSAPEAFDPGPPTRHPGIQTGDPHRVAELQRRVSKPAVVRPGRSEARWENPIIDAAMPILLRLDPPTRSGRSLDESLRSQLALEMRLFRDRVGKRHSPEVVADASYLLCTYVDELINDHARAAGRAAYNGESSLLVQFHGDAFGGEDAFADLERWMACTPVERAILEFYELILAFGWEGRYRVTERGPVLLGDLRARLHALIWNGHQPARLAAPVAVPVPAGRKRWLNLPRAFGIGASLVLALYAALVVDLDLKGRPIRQALAAWNPPIRTIDLAETLPPPLPRLIAEGWITARKVPLGWLLVFKSDNAFDVGQANFRPEFRQQLDRLGAAFAPWPGDMEVVGHSDTQPIKTKQFADNLALSHERARVVARELFQTAVADGARAPAGATLRQIVWSGKGDTDPVDPANTASAFERNRRVEILWKVAKSGPQGARTVER